MVKSEIRRGDIVFVADNQQHSPHDFIIYGNHPAVVVQNNVGNAYSQSQPLVSGTINSYKRIIKYL